MSGYVSYDSHKEENIDIKSRKFILQGKLPIETVNVLKFEIPERLINQENRLERNYFQSLKQLAEHYLTLPIIATQEHFLVSFAYADIFIGKTFEIAFHPNNPNEGIRCKSIIRAILNEYLLFPVDRVECGHKSICLIDFPDGIPNIISQMKQVTRFMQAEYSERVFLCNAGTL